MDRYLPGKSAPRLVESNHACEITGNAVDAELLARIATRDLLAMQVLHIRHYARIRRFILRFAGDEDLADALVHEVFLHVWLHADRFVGRGPVSTWLLCVARQKTIPASASHDGHRRKLGAA